MQFIRLANVADFDGRWYKSYKILGRYIGIFRRPDGSFYAMEVNCRHQNADLTTGIIRNGIATCPRHGWQYDLRTGKCVSGASDAPLRRHGIRIENGAIHVTMFPLPEGSDEDLKDAQSDLEPT
jgi:nitrite reductase/ring-hydroxylating ferredoxin subunit